MGRLDLGNPALDSGTGITGGGSGYAAILAHAGGALYGTELGSVTLRVRLFCFPIKHSTRTHTELGSVTFKRVGSFCSPTKHITHTVDQAPGLGKRPTYQNEFR
jgi:hypothetical protein